MRNIGETRGPRCGVPPSKLDMNPAPMVNTGTGLIAWESASWPLACPTATPNSAAATNRIRSPVERVELEQANSICRRPSAQVTHGNAGFSKYPALSGRLWRGPEQVNNPCRGGPPEVISYQATGPHVFWWPRSTCPCVQYPFGAPPAQECALFPVPEDKLTFGRTHAHSRQI